LRLYNYDLDPHPTSIENVLNNYDLDPHWKTCANGNKDTQFKEENREGGHRHLNLHLGSDEQDWHLVAVQHSALAG
jgi:hypothetical protein